MEITTFRDLWGFCRERSGGEEFVITVDGKPAKGFHMTHAPDGPVMLNVTTKAKPVERPASPVEKPKRRR